MENGIYIYNMPKHLSYNI